MCVIGLSRSDSIVSQNGLFVAALAALVSYVVALVMPIRAFG